MPSGASIGSAHETTIEAGFHSMYNLDFDQAHRRFGAWQAAHPDDPMGSVSQAAAYLFSEFDRLGVLETELFTDDDRFDARKRLSPDPQLKEKLMAALASGDQLCEQALAKDPSDTNALFARVLAFGLRSDYAALIEKHNFDALRYTKQGRTFAEDLLKAKPDAYDANLAVGMENYMAGLKAAPLRWMLQMGGVETDKDKGVRELEQTAAHGDLLEPFAKLMLAVAALRDKDVPRACGYLHELANRFPKNQLYSRELYQCR